MRCATSRVVRPQAARTDQKLCLHPPRKNPPKQSLAGGANPVLCEEENRAVLPLD